MIPISLYEFLKKSMLAFRWKLSLGISILITIIAGFYTLNQQITSEQKSLTGISPHLAYLVEISDRTELLRLLDSVTLNGTTKIKIVTSGYVFANSYDLSLIDMADNKASSFLSALGSFFSIEGISISSPLLGKDKTILGETIVIIPYSLIATELVFVLITSFAVSMFLLYLLSLKTEEYIKKALHPLGLLEDEIVNFHNPNHESKKLEFIELENIRKVITETKENLIEMNEKLANQKAKEINAEIYRRLIHDLQNPITALQTMVTLICEKDTESDIVKEATDVLPKITEEILNQILHAKKNFEFDIKTLAVRDIRLCLSEVLAQVKLANPGNFHKIKYITPKDPIYVPCDSFNLKRAIINIVENGFEACRETLEIRLAQSSLHTSIYIADDGNGLSEDNVEEILSGKAISNKGNREALGISSVKHILETHKGKLVYQKSKYGGAEFELRVGELC